MFIELNNKLHQFFYDFIQNNWNNSDSILGPELHEKLLSANAWLCVIVVYFMVILILKFPIGFAFEFLWSKILGGYVRDRGKKDKNKTSYKSFNFLEQFDRFQSNR